MAEAARRRGRLRRVAYVLLLLAHTAVLSSTLSAAPVEPATITFFNRPIVTLHAELLGRSPADRARAAEHVLHDLVAEQVVGPVDSRLLESGLLITVGPKPVMVLVAADVD